MNIQGHGNIQSNIDLQWHCFTQGYALVRIPQKIYGKLSSHIYTSHPNCSYKFTGVFCVIRRPVHHFHLQRWSNKLSPIWCLVLLCNPPFPFSQLLWPLVSPFDPYEFLVPLE